MPVPDNLMRDLQRLIDNAVNLPYDDAETLLEEIIADAENALEDLRSENKE